MTEEDSSPSLIRNGEEIPKEVLDDIYKDEYNEDIDYPNKNKIECCDLSLGCIGEKTCHCFNEFISKETLIPLGLNILLWGWMAVAILNYADVIDLPRKNFFGDFFDFIGKGFSSSTDTSNQTGDDDGIGIL